MCIWRPPGKPQKWPGLHSMYAYAESWFGPGFETDEDQKENEQRRAGTEIRMDVEDEHENGSRRLA